MKKLINILILLVFFISCKEEPDCPCGFEETCVINGIRYWNGLKYLYFTSAKIEEIPECIGNLTSLEEISFMKNSGIIYIPESFGKLDRLKKLWLNECSIKYISNGFCGMDLLEELDLSDNEIDSLPYNIGELLHLTKLWAMENQIKEIPESIGDLSNVVELAFRKNEITGIPESIGNLDKLQKLYLQDNKLTILPESIKNLAGNLKELWLTGNLLTEEEKQKIREWLPNTELHL
ncbi:MAG: leucine-rich repeat domain-containing protein [bacterium]